MIVPLQQLDHNWHANDAFAVEGYSAKIVGEKKRDNEPIRY